MPGMDKSLRLVKHEPGSWTNSVSGLKKNMSGRVHFETKITDCRIMGTGRFGDCDALHPRRR